MRFALSRLWGPVVVEARVPAPRTVVYAILRAPETYPEWLVGAANIRAVDDRFPDAGAEFHHSVGPGGPLTIDDRTESISADDERRPALRVHAGPFHARVEFQLYDAPDGATRVRFSEQPIGAVALMTPLLRWSLYARNRTSLKQLSDVASDVRT